MGQTVSDSVVFTDREYRPELMTPEVYEKYWPHISEQLDLVPHIWTPWYTKEFLRYGVMEQEFLVCGIGTATELRLITFARIVDYPTGRTLQIFLALGNDLINCLPSLRAMMEKLANVTDSTSCEIIGREGWAKLLPEFQKVSTTFRLELKPFQVQ